MKNPVAKHSRKFNKAVVHTDRKKESKRNPSSLQHHEEVLEYILNKEKRKELKKQQKHPSHNQW
tara:strand:- start:610 stop:801 length:192 start_codon:yes stop_codon:yes gene_type:complete